VFLSSLLSSFTNVKDVYFKNRLLYCGKAVCNTMFTYSPASGNVYKESDAVEIEAKNQDKVTLKS